MQRKQMSPLFTVRHRITALVTKRRFIQSVNQLASRQMAFVSKDQKAEILDAPIKAEFASGLGGAADQDVRRA